LSRWIHRLFGHHHDASALALEDRKLWVIDGEMSGLNAHRDELLSLAAIPILGDTLEINNSQYWLCEPLQQRHDPNMVAIHGITPEQSKHSEPIHDSLDRMYACLHQSVCVGHMVSLDCHFIEKCFKDHQRPSPDIIGFDTAQLWRWWRRRSRPHADLGTQEQQLLYIAQVLNVPTWPNHHAMNDALTCGSVFLKLRSLAKQRGVIELKDLKKLKA
jgi:DNA polymerase-3 subunit epsilon